MDTAAGQVEASQSIIIQFIFGRFSRKHLLPHALALSQTRKWEGYDETQAAHEGSVQGTFHVGGQNSKAAIRLHALQQVIDLDIGVAVVAVLDFAAFAEEGIGLVEEEDGPAILRGIEEAAQVFLGLADVFAYDRREVDAIEVEAQGVGDDFGCHRLAGATLTCKEGVDAQAAVLLLGT